MVLRNFLSATTFLLIWRWLSSIDWRSSNCSDVRQSTNRSSLNSVFMTFSIVVLIHYGNPIVEVLDFVCFLSCFECWQLSIVPFILKWDKSLSSVQFRDDDCGTVQKSVKYIIVTSIFCMILLFCIMFRSKWYCNF